MAESEPSVDPVSAEEFERRARERLDFTLPADLFEGGGSFVGDHSLDDGPAPAGRLRPAAVLVPVVAHRRLATVLLTLRPHGMRDHSGQIAFPGGKIEACDPSPQCAALREAEEEIGLSRHNVTPIGYLDPYVTGTGFIVVPTVATVASPYELKLDPREVVEAFEVPLSFLMNPSNHERRMREVGDRRRHFYAMPFETRYIWGATAGILRALYDRLYG